MAIRYAVRGHVAILALLSLVVAIGAAQPPRESSGAVRDFEARVANYMQLRNTAPAAAGTRKPSTSADKLLEQRNQIKSRVLEGRPHAKQGDIFTPEIASYFRRQIESTLSGARGRRIRQSLRHAEPVHIQLAVNEAYPANVPLQSTPPSLLLNLPQLPKDLEYRVVGRDLVLRDTGANIVVDFIPGILPQS